MAYLSEDRINAWLASTKYTITSVDPELERGVIDFGFAKLGERYATSDWVDEATTPSLVLSALSMVYASWFLQRQISDDEMSDQDYPIRLERRAWDLLCGIANGSIEIPGVDPDPTLTANHTALFFPTDRSTELALYDPSDPDGSPRAFTMGQVF